MSATAAAHERVNIPFVLEVEKYPCLYDIRLPEYGRKESTERAWEKIGVKFNLTGAECKERWKNIRSVFVRQLKPPKPGCGKIKKPYYLSEYMQFTIPFIKLSAFENPEPRRLVYQNLPDNDIDDDDITDEMISANSLQDLQPEPTEALPKSDSVELQGSSRPPSLFSADQPSPSPSEHDVQAKTLKRKYDNRTEQNSNRLFLLSLLSDMNKMNDRQRRVFRHKLLNLVDEILDGDDNNAKLQNKNKIAKQTTSSRALINNINDILSSATIAQNLSDDDHINYVIKTEYDED